MLWLHLVFGNLNELAGWRRKMIVSVFLVCHQVVHAQQAGFAHLGVEQGLSQNSVLSIAQDDRGFMWFGTRYGLNRFDGSHVVIYKHDPANSHSISDNYINVLLFDSRHTLWAGTEKGLNKYDPETNTFQRIGFPGNFPAPVVNSIIEEQNGRLLAGTSRGLFYLPPVPGATFLPADQLGMLPALKGRSIRRLFKDSHNHIWVSCGQELYLMVRHGEKYTEKLFTSNPADPATLSDNFVQSIKEDQQGRIWIGTLKGLNCYDPATGQFTRFLYNSSGPGLINNNVRSLLVDRTGKIWIGTQEGISLLDPATRQWTSYINDAADEKSLSQNSVHSIFEDANGSVWVGTFFGGVNVTHRFSMPFTAWQHSPAEPGISNNVVSSVMADANNNLWIGTEGGGLNFYNRATGQFTVYKNKPGVAGAISSNLVKTIFIDKDRQVWVGTHGGGLNLFDARTGQFRYYFYNENDVARKQSEVVALMEDRQGRFWMGSHPGVKLLQRRGSELVSLGYEAALKELDNKNISALVQDKKGNTWIGALEGLYLFNEQTKTLQAMPVNNKATPNINCIKEDAQGKIWLGLYNEGLALYQPQHKGFIIYTTQQGLPNNNVLGILEDDAHQLWISTSNGLARFDPATKIFQTYTTSDGLAGNEFNYNAFFKKQDGEMFFGGIKGFTSFYPNRIERNSKASPLVFTGLKIFNTPVQIGDAHEVLKKDMSLTDQLSFSHKQNTFTIEFALLNFIRSDKNKYAYKLGDVQKEWTEINTPSATFTNLPAGNYTLFIKGANNDGVWSRPVALRIQILPPFWKTGWAYLLYALLAATLVFFITRFFYLRALLARDKELHEMKLNFFTNISHEIRTHLTLIMAPLEKLQRDHAGNNLLLHHLDNARNNANRLLKLVSELMDFRKAETHHLHLHIGRYDLIAFLNGIYTSFEDLSLAKNIRLSFVHDTPAAGLYFDKTQMEKVVYNLLTNAFKFTPEGGAISLIVENTPDTVRIHVTDNGRGIEPQYVNKLFTNYFQVDSSNQQNTGYGIGLALSKTIVELHKGSIVIESTPAKGHTAGHTRFTVTLQKGNKHLQGLDLAPNPPSPPYPFEPAAGHITEHTPQPYHILITEDNDEVRALIRDTLQHYTLTECADGAKGWSAATEQIPDLVISDVMMPEMDGFSFCHRLKTDERTSHIPVVLLTAKSSQTDQVNGLSTGADVYITKPFSTQVLELSVKNLLAGREKMRQKFSREFVLAPQNTVINNLDEQFLSRFIHIIEEHMDSPDFGVELLAEKMAMSQSVLYKKVKALTDMSVNDFAKTIRLKKAAQLLQQKQYSVFDVSVMVGFNDRKYFSKEFKKQFGVAPSEYM